MKENGCYKALSAVEATGHFLDRLIRRIQYFADSLGGPVKEEIHNFPISFLTPQSILLLFLCRHVFLRIQPGIPRPGQNFALPLISVPDALASRLYRPPCLFINSVFKV